MPEDTENRHPGRPPVLSRDGILAAASTLPLAGFSMRALAERLGVSPQSIYYYFKSKNALLAAIGEQDVAHLPEIDARDWRSYVRTTLLTYRNLLRNAESPTAHANLGGRWAHLDDQPSEAFVTRMEAFVTFLTGAGFTPIEAVEIWLLGTTLVVRSLVAKFSQETATTQHHDLLQILANLGPDRFPAIREALGDIQTPSIDEVFERHVDIVIEGIAAVYKR